MSSSEGDSLTSQDLSTAFTRMSWVTSSRLELGDRIASGSFSSVYEAKSKPTKNCADSSSSGHTIPLSDSFSSLDGFVQGALVPGKRYVIKKLNESTLASNIHAKAAANDLAYEAMLLAMLPSHPNVIRLHAVSEGFWDDPATGFLVLERLMFTLQDQLMRWRKIHPCFMGRHYPNSDMEQLSRIQEVGLPIVYAVAFLHSHGVCFRDLKPSNVGFDDCSRVCLFDFGLARKIRDPEQGISGTAGTTRYMPPEVLEGRRYHLSADIYSLSVLLWELCSLQKPYQRITMASADHLIRERSVRPPVRAVCKPLRDLLRQAWDKDPQKRPTAAMMVDQLTNIVLEK